MSLDGVKIEWNDKELVAEIKTAVKAGTGAGAKRIFNSAKGTSDFIDDTGNLRKSIKMYPSKFKDGGYIVVATAPHAYLVEYGHAIVERGGFDEGGVITGYVPPHPFMRNAVKKNRARAEQDIFNAVKDALR